MIVYISESSFQQALSALREIQTKTIESSVINIHDAHVISMLASSVENVLTESLEQESNDAA
jgi:hypothetical protein